MSIDSYILQKALEIHKDKSEHYQNGLLRKFDDLKKQLPEYAELENAQYLLGAEIAQSVLDGNAAEILNSIKPRADALAARKAELLAAYNLPESGLPEPLCRRCDDTGFVNNNMCSCLQAIYKDVQYQEYNAVFSVADGVEQHFRAEDYNNTVNPRSGWSDRVNMQGLVRKFSDFPSIPTQNMLLTNGCSYGKKFLISMLLRKAIEDSVFVVYQSAFSLSKLFEDDRYGKSDLAASKLERIRSSQLLIIDSLGTEPVSAYYNGALLDLIDNRLAEGLRTICSVTISPSTVSSYYNPEIAFRLNNFIPYNVPLNRIESKES